MTQKTALRILLGGRNVFLTGPPGSGKTHLLNKFVEESIRTGKNVAVTATTGVAATHILGQTINSWAGIGLTVRSKLANPQVLKERFNKTDVLIIDEISMMNSRTFDLLDILAKINRKNSLPFGGMQIILVGDFFQLPPVTKLDEKPKYIFKSLVWSDLDLVFCYLDSQYRQIGDDELYKVLVAIRNGQFGNIEQKIVSTRQHLQPNDPKVLRLFTHNYDADKVNQEELAKLPGNCRVYKAHMSGSKVSLNVLMGQILSPEILELKTGSEIMFVVNNFEVGYVNGSRGIVKELKNDTIIVRIYGGGYIQLKRHKFVLDSDLYLPATISQFPIKLAWGLTIHKSQGMTLDSAVIDLSHAFTPNMGYVALSRIRSLEGLYLGEYNAMAFLISDEIRHIDAQFRKLSDKISA